jgi:phosphopantetheine--protein transferase-like protein
MEKDITDIYTKLSGGKQITSEEYTITKGDFNSIMVDRFKAELLKAGIKWNGEDVQYKNLVGGGKPVISAAKTNGVSQPVAAKNNVPAKGFAVGIDIQRLAELPESNDYWEDAFYKTKFKPEEIAYCVKKESPRESFAGLYAAKEALVKCDNSLDWDNILISYDENGKPAYSSYFISVSHSGDTAVAIALQNNNSQQSSNGIIEPKAAEAIPAPVKIVDAPRPKSYNKLYFLAILVIVAYIVVRDFILKH